MSDDARFDAGAQTIKRDPSGIMLQLPNETLRIGVCSGRVIHVEATPADDLRKSVVPVVIRPCSGAPFTISSNATTVLIKTSELHIEIERQKGTVRFLTSTGLPVLSEQSDGGRTIASVTADGPNEYRVRQDFRLTPGEAIYGLGQRQEGFLNLRDIPVRLLQANTNIAIPFLVSTNGYGLLWNSAALTNFNPANQTIQLDADGTGTFKTGAEGEYGFLLTGNSRSKLQLSVNDEKVIDIQNMWVPWSASGKIHLEANKTYPVKAETGGNTELSVRTPSDSMAFQSEVGSAVDYYFIFGPELNQVIAQYREFTGSAPMLPRWAYGFWQCRERYSSQQQILDTAADFRARKIPVDALVQDWQYWGKYGWNAMKFDESAYPDPAKMMDELHRQDLHMVISVWAKFGSETQVDHDFVNAHLVLTSNASTGEPGEAKEQENWADLFNPSAQKLYWSEMNRNLFSLGLDGWWLDASEPEGDPLKNDETYLGSGEMVRNAFPLFETSAVYDGQRATNANKRVVILSRSAYAGQQRNGSISWSGDISANWDTLRRQIPAGLSFAMSGFPYWTTDIGGFFRPADQYTSTDYHELLIRWFEFGTFCPIFRIHGYRSETEMWKYGPEVEKDLREFDGLRYRLMPYIYSAAWEVTSRGGSVMQALPFVYPKDLALREVDDEYLFGDSMLVSPVTQPNVTERSVVLPRGNDWVDFWSGKGYLGGQTIVADAQLNRIPIFIKEGSLVPMGPVVQSTAEAQDPLEIRIYGGRDADFQLYQDSGDGYAYEHGARATINLHWDDRRNMLSIGDRVGAFPGMESKQTFHIVLVKEAHGVGMGLESVPDRTVDYAGHQMTIRLSKAG
jgi:alpha-D-xyloside xylohydrolase